MVVRGDDDEEEEGPDEGAGSGIHGLDVGGLDDDPDDGFRDGSDISAVTGSSSSSAGNRRGRRAAAAAAAAPGALIDVDGGGGAGGGGDDGPGSAAWLSELEASGFTSLTKGAGGEVYLERTSSVTRKKKTKKSTTAKSTAGSALSGSSSSSSSSSGRSKASAPSSAEWSKQSGLRRVLSSLTTPDQVRQGGSGRSMHGCESQ